MADRLVMDRPVTPSRRPVMHRYDDAGMQAYSVLYFGFIVAPIVAGVDKFFHFLVDWTQYLAPVVTRLTGISPDVFMRGVGVIEIAAGVLVLVKPRYGAFVVVCWHLAVIANLLMIPGFYDIAFRDFGLVLAAFALWRLSFQYGR